MPQDLLKKIDLDKLYPPFLEALLDVLAACRAQGVDYKVYSGFRSHEEQRRLHENFLAGGARAAPPGLSAHNYGLAVDCARLLPDGKLSWDLRDYRVLLKNLPSQGLRSGAAYNDTPHINWPGYESAVALRALDKLYYRGAVVGLEALKAVWKYLDSERTK